MMVGSENKKYKRKIYFSR